MMKLVIATNNVNKFKEFKIMLNGYAELYSLNNFTNITPKETGFSFIENALIKARYASLVSNLPALGDDSGLMVNYLSGKPGIYSSRYANSNLKNDETKDNIFKLLKDLKHAKKNERCATLISVLALVRNYSDPIPIICEGILKGSILFKPTGKYGFGYDSLFWNPKTKCSNAELPLPEKTKLSHRANAVKMLKKRLKLLINE